MVVFLEVLLSLLTLHFGELQSLNPLREVKKKRRDGVEDPSLYLHRHHRVTAITLDPCVNFGLSHCDGRQISSVPGFSYPVGGRRRGKTGGRDPGPTSKSLIRRPIHPFLGV